MGPKSNEVPSYGTEAHEGASSESDDFEGIGKIVPPLGTRIRRGVSSALSGTYVGDLMAVGGRRAARIDAKNDTERARLIAVHIDLLFFNVHLYESVNTIEETFRLQIYNCIETWCSIWNFCDV